MNPPQTPTPHRLGLFSNWISLAGWVIVAGGLFSFLLLFALDAFAPSTNPYVGILAYLVAPFFVVLGLGGVGLGVFLERRRLVRVATQPLPAWILDLSRLGDRCPATIRFAH